MAVFVKHNKPNTSTKQRKFINEIRLHPDFDEEFSSETPVDQNPQTGEYYSSVPRNGEEYYSPIIGSFLVDTTNVIGATQPGDLDNNQFVGSPVKPAKVQIPLIPNGFALTATSSFSPTTLGISGSVPYDMGWRAFDKSNNTRFMCNSIELTYTTMFNPAKPGGSQTENFPYYPVNEAAGYSTKTNARHKTIIATWSPYAMMYDENIPDYNYPVLPTSLGPTFDDYNHFHIFENSRIHYNGGIAFIPDAINTITGPNLADNISNTNDPYLNIGGGNNAFGNPTFTADQTNVPYSVAGGILDQPSVTVDDSYGEISWNKGYHAPRVRVLPRWNYTDINSVPEDNGEVDIPKHFKGPTPVFEFFVTQPHVFVKGTYKIY